MGVPKKLGVDTFPDPVGHYGFCRQCGVAVDERVTPAPLGWYFQTVLIVFATYVLIFKIAK